MALTFPNNPTEGQIFTSGSDSWYWTGSYWEVQPVTSPTFDDTTVSGTLEVDGNTTLNNLEVTGNLINFGLDKISDVSVPTPLDGQVLQYDSAEEQWNSVSLSSTFVGGNVPNATTFQNATSSITSATGAVKITGGLGVTENINATGYIASTSNVQLKTNAVLRFNDANDSNYVGLKAPSTVGTNITWTLPSADGSSGQFLRTNGLGALSWATPAGGGGGGGGGETPPGGSDTHVQYNDAGSFAGSSNFTFNSGTNQLSISLVSVTESTASTTSSTGALRVSGGAGIAGQLNVAGATNKFTGATASSSTTTGTVVITGGVGVSGEMYVGSTVTASTAPTATGHLTNKQYVDEQISAFSIAFGV